ncbi:MAG: hypothetical protein ABJE47_25065 [bacterium]
MRKRVTEETWTEVVDVPLYRFGAPPVQGAKVEYSEGDTFTGGSGWNVKFQPVGVSASTTIEVSKSRTFVTTDGAHKQVYVPVMVHVRRVAIYDGDELVGRGHEAEVAPPSESGDPLLQKRGIRSVDGTTSADGVTPEYYDIVDLALAGDTSGAVHKEKRAWVTDVGREISLSLGKIADVSALVRVKRTRRLELAFELPAGHDYRAYLCDGYTQWDSPRGKIEKAPRTFPEGKTAA